MKILKKIVFSLLFVFICANMCFGHACHDPWRPTPSAPGSGGDAPPPPPPTPPPPSLPPSPESPSIPPVDPGSGNQTSVPSSSNIPLSDIPQAASPGEGLAVGKIFVSPEIKQIKLIE